MYYNNFIKRLFFAAICCVLFIPISATAQLSANDRAMAIGMLEQTRDTIKENYYDPKLKGIDIDFVFEHVKEQMKAAQTRDALMVNIAQFTLAFNDSHTAFAPPSRAADVEYGWDTSMIGDKCFIIAVKPGSDAEAKGVKVGDELVAIDGFRPSRKNLHQMYYRYFALMPASRVRMTLASPGEQSRVLDVQTKIAKTVSVVNWEDMFIKLLRKGKDKRAKMKYYEYGNELMIWRMPSFSISGSAIDTMMGKAKNFKSLILDLRDNSGGYLDNEKRLLGYFFDKEIKIGDEKTRKQTKPMFAKSHGKDLFKGNLIVLVNHNSASASEIFARLVQLEKRGKVLGDQTAGAVMTSKFYLSQIGIGQTLYFGTSVSVSDLIMPDGVSLEHVGVVPDDLRLPSGADLAASKDPVLAHAAKLMGVELTAEKAGTMFPYEWE